MEQNRLIQGDCIEGLERLEAGSVDLVFADPPFNIGYDYDVYDDRCERDEYLDWTPAVDGRAVTARSSPTARSGWPSATSTPPN